jgi:hypothetical protein
MSRYQTQPIKTTIMLGLRAPTGPASRAIARLSQEKLPFERHARRAHLAFPKDGNNTTKDANTQTTALITRNAEIENIHTAAQDDAGFEKILKFKKGEYFIGEDLIPLGTEFLAHTVGWTKSWIKFVDGEVAERKAYRVALGKKPPVREDLDARNEDEWPEGLDGRPSDPWVYQYLLPLENLKNGEVIIFVTSSFGGKRAVADLCDTFAKHSKKTGCGQPIVKLATTDMPTKRYGKVPRPLFEIVGWDRQEAAGDVNIIPPATSEADFQDDDIPY